MHPETEIISLAIKYGDEQTQVIFGEDLIREHLEAQDWSDVMLVAHNMSAFDAMIFAWRFKVQPKVWGCTLAMARPIHSKTCGNSLGALVKKYSLGEKDNTALINTKGKHLVDFTREELRAMRKYNCDDTDQCYALFQVLRKHYKAEELWHIDSTIRMLVEPKFVMDKRVLDGALSDSRIQKQQSLAAMARVLYGDAYDEADADEDNVRSVLASTPKFKLLLESLGVDVPTKASPSDPAKQIPALSKTDQEFLDLQEHEDPVVALAASTRLDVKSTLLQTRLESFITTGKRLRGKLPIPLHYCGADTTGRWSGFLYNPQNLPRIDPSKPKLSDALRKSMIAPPGYKVVVADLSGIELRVNHFLWKVLSSMALYKESPDKADLYKDFAQKLYNVPLEQVTKPQRQIGKVAHLGLGFGAGAATFQKVAKIMGGIDLSLDEAQAVTTQWRNTYEDIVLGWRRCHEMLHYIQQGERLIVDPWAMMETSREGIHLPSGRMIRYPALREEVGDNGRKEWVYGSGRHQARIYAGKVTENCLAEGTQVLTDSGWKSIETVGLCDKVHDGVEFVSHDGIVFKSIQSCVTVDGVYMTPDHEVLTDEGWQEASQVQRPYWLCIRGVDSAAPGIFDGALVEVAVFVPMRRADSEVRLGHNQGNKTRRDSQLRVFAREPDICEESHAWNEQAPGVCCLPKYVGPVQQPEPQGVEKLRGAWNHCVQSLATVFRELLDRHAGRLRFWSGLGSGGQQRGLLSGELSLGGSAYQLDEQANDYTDRGRPSTKQADGDWQKHAVQPHPERLADRQVNNEAITSKPVYDILNCGPRSRFVVNGDTAPFIVHNCVQALARDVIAGNAYQMYKQTKLRPSLAVHDELVYVVPDSDAVDALKTLQTIMRTAPTWWPQLITWSEGDIAQSYGEAK